MRHQLTPINTRPWLLGALRRLNAITEQLQSLDFDKTPGHVVNSSKREDLIALNSTLPSEATPLRCPIRAWWPGRVGRRCRLTRRPWMAGATWRDPDRVEEWIAELTPNKPVGVYCAYGFDVGCNVTKTLIERGLDARFIRGGVAAWYASGGARAQADGGIARSISSRAALTTRRRGGTTRSEGARLGHGDSGGDEGRR